MSHIYAFSFLLIFVSVSLISQTKYRTKTGRVTFEASVMSFEQVKANNNNTAAIIDTENGNFAVAMQVTDFHFKNSLMEEHFNENYAESDIYPKATFKGHISQFDLNVISGEKARPFYVNGYLSFHGKTKYFEDIPFNILKQNDNAITISGSFYMNASDFEIKIPKIVRKKVSKDVNVSFDFELLVVN